MGFCKHSLGAMGGSEENIQIVVVDLTRTKFRCQDKIHLSGIDQSGSIKYLC